VFKVFACIVRFYHIGLSKAYGYVQSQCKGTEDVTWKVWNRVISSVDVLLFPFWLQWFLVYVIGKMTSCGIEESQEIMAIMKLSVEFKTLSYLDVFFWSTLLFPQLLISLFPIGHFWIKYWDMIPLQSCVILFLVYCKLKVQMSFV
jgi:hypothetical protein